MALVLPVLGISLLVVVSDVLGRGAVGVLSWIIVGACVCVAACTQYFASTRYEIIADANGVTVRRLGRMEHYRWPDIAEIGVAVQRGLEGWNTSGGRAWARIYRVDVRAFREPMIGLNMTDGCSPHRDPGRRAYQRGFTGYEINLPNYFERSVADMVSELNERRPG